MIQQGAECAVILYNDRFGCDEVEVAFVDLALDEQVLEAGESKVVFCWMRTSGDIECGSMVIRTRVSMYLARDEREREISAHINSSAVVVVTGQGNSKENPHQMMSTMAMATKCREFVSMWGTMDQTRNRRELSGEHLQDNRRGGRNPE